jgi:hypothetical protein
MFFSLPTNSKPRNCSAIFRRSYLSLFVSYIVSSFLAIKRKEETKEHYSKISTIKDQTVTIIIKLMKTLKKSRKTKR